MTAALDDVWRGLTGEPLPEGLLTVHGRAELPGAFRVGDAAVASIGACLVAGARWLGARSAALAAAGAVAAFVPERRLRVDGQVPQIWDPIAGDYPTADGWVRLHTNYASHRAAALRALALPPDAARDVVAATLAERPADDVESAVIAQGGAAAALRSRPQWLAHPQAAAVRARPLVEVRTAAGSSRRAPDAARVRVLDLTRVIAAPTATKVLGAFGADVLRLDAPGFEELPVLVADTTAGKRCARLDLRASGDRFAELVAAADVLVCGLRPGALAGLGWPAERLLEVNPGLVLAELSAYGDTGPWAGRRGFDSLVQTVDGIAHEGMLHAATDRPVPLPAQAIDHASGWLLAAGVLHALALRRQDGQGRRVGVVLARTGEWIEGLGRRTDGPEPAEEPLEVPVEEVSSPLGLITRVACPGELDGRPLRWAGPPSPLGSAEPRFAAPS